MTKRNTDKEKTNMQVSKATLDRFADFCYAYSMTRDGMLTELMNQCQPAMEARLKKKVMNHAAAIAEKATSAPRED